MIWRRAIGIVFAAALAVGGASPCLADPQETDSAASTLDRDYVAGRKALESNNWNAAIKSLSAAARRNPGNADIQNYLGFAYRKSRHRGAHEYIGEAYLMKGDLKSAEKHLAALREICSLPCEELTDLEREIAKHVKKSPVKGSR